MSAKKHLLVIRLSAMGDVAMTVPVIAAFLSKYSDYKVTVLTRAFFKPIFSQVPNVQVYEADVKGKHKGVLGLWRLYQELKGLKIDAVADLHNVLRSKILKQYFKLGGFHVVQVNKGRAEKRALTAANNKVFKPLKTTHQRYADVFEKLGFPLDLNARSFLGKRELTSEVEKFLAVEGKQTIGVAPFAAFEGKMYPIDLMENVISELDGTGLYKILLFGGGKNEQEQLEKWEKKYSNIACMVGKAKFSEELDVISNLDLMLAMDSGNAHLAALFGIPVVTVWGVTHPYAGFYPFGQDIENALLADREKFPLIPTSVYGNKAPEGYDQVMRTIAPLDIFGKIVTILKKKQK